MSEYYDVLVDATNSVLLDLSLCLMYSIDMECSVVTIKIVSGVHCVLNTGDTQHNTTQSSPLMTVSTCGTVIKDHKVHQWIVSQLSMQPLTPSILQELDLTTH